MLRAAFNAAKSRKEKGRDDAWGALKRVSLLLEREDRTNTKILVPRQATLGVRQVLHWARAQRRLLELSDVKNDMLFQEAVEAMVAAKDDADDEGEVDGDDAQTVNVGDFDYEDDLVRFMPAVNGGWDSAGGRIARFHEESPEETEVRRRRREAMVLHEGGGTLGREDIIHPRTRS